MFAKMKSDYSKSGIFYYICNSKMRGSKALCDCQNLRGKEIDDLVCDYLKDYINEGSNIYDLLKDLKKKIKNEEVKKPLEVIESEITKYKKEMDNYIQVLSKSSLSDVVLESVNKKVIGIDLQIKDLLEQKTQIEKDNQYMDSTHLNLDVIVNMLAYFKENFKDLSIHDKRDIIKLLVEKIEWDGKKFDIFIYGE